MTFSGVPFRAPSEDFVEAGSTEIWKYINSNHDAHPMHVHLVNFQVLNRQPIDAAATGGLGPAGGHRGEDRSGESL
nr:multicopper oxidase domain-containing protein [Planomonospora venezuelensis]